MFNQSNQKKRAIIRGKKLNGLSSARNSFLVDEAPVSGKLQLRRHGVTSKTNAKLELVVYA